MKTAKPLDSSMIEWKTVEQMLAHRRLTLSGCWEWDGALAAGGYASTSTADGTKTGHRVMYAAMRGPIPAGAVLDHTCRNRICINPWHLRLTTQRENLRVGNSKSSATIAAYEESGTCAKGHDLTTDEAWYRDPKRPGSRACKECRRENVRRYQRRRKAAMAHRVA